MLDKIFCARIPPAGGGGLAKYAEIPPETLPSPAPGQHVANLSKTRRRRPQRRRRRRTFYVNLLCSFFLFATLIFVYFCWQQPPDKDARDATHNPQTEQARSQREKEIDREKERDGVWVKAGGK